MTTRLLQETGDALLAETGTDYLVLDIGYIGAPTVTVTPGLGVAPLLAAGRAVTPQRVAGAGVNPIISQGH